MKLFKRLLPSAICAVLLCSLLTDPSLAVTGTVVGPDNSPLANAKVVCEIQENGTWREWASEFYQVGDIDPSLYPDLREGAEDYGQSPSMYTGEDGRCGWMLPPGTFRFKVTADGYQEFTSVSFTVGNQSGNVDNSHDLNQLKLSPDTSTPPPSTPPTTPPTPTPSGDPTPSPTPTPGGDPTPSPSPSGTPSSSGGGGTITVSTPQTAKLMTLNLAAGTVPKGSKLTLTVADDKAAKNVTFHYTTDGSTPTRKSAQFVDPIVIDKNMTIKIIAIKGTTRGTVESYTFTVSDDIRPGSLTPEASATRYLAGYDDGTFRPDQPATRYEVVDALNYLLVLGDGSTAASLTDVTSAHSLSVSRLLEAGIINGYDDGTFQGNGSLTRVQVCKILCLVLGLESDAQFSQSFSDVAGHWGIGFIGALAKEGYLKGYDDGSFRPDRPVTRAELAVLFNRVAGRKDVTDGAVEYSDVPSDFWAYDDIHSACLDIKASAEQK